MSLRQFLCRPPPQEDFFLNSFRFLPEPFWISSWTFLDFFLNLFGFPPDYFWITFCRAMWQRRPVALIVCRCASFFVVPLLKMCFFPEFFQISSWAFLDFFLNLLGFPPDYFWITFCRAMWQRRPVALIGCRCASFFVVPLLKMCFFLKSFRFLPGPFWISSWTFLEFLQIICGLHSAEQCDKEGQ